jgi:hypothetical protein
MQDELEDIKEDLRKIKEDCLRLEYLSICIDIYKTEQILCSTSDLSSDEFRKAAEAISEHVNYTIDSGVRNGLLKVCDALEDLKTSSFHADIHCNY